jgi:hypothetical protein
MDGGAGVELLRDVACNHCNEEPFLCHASSSGSGSNATQQLLRGRVACSAWLPCVPYPALLAVTDCASSCFCCCCACIFRLVCCTQDNTESEWEPEYVGAGLGLIPEDPMNWQYSLRHR